MKAIKFRCHNLNGLIGGQWKGQYVDMKPKDGTIAELQKYMTDNGCSFATREGVPTITYPWAGDFVEIEPENGKRFLKKELIAIIADLPENLVKVEGFDDITKTHQHFIQRRCEDVHFGVRNIVTTRQMQKGIELEVAALKFVQANYYKNKVLLSAYITGRKQHRVENECIVGHTDSEPFAWKGKTIIVDVKVCYNVLTFLEKRREEKQKPSYKDQGQGYCWAGGADEFHLHYVLLETPEWIITKECKSHFYASGVSGRFDDVYGEFCLLDVLPGPEQNKYYSNLFKDWAQIHQNHNIEVIPEKERVITYTAKACPEWQAKTEKILKRAQEYAAYYLENQIVFEL